MTYLAKQGTIIASDAVGLSSRLSMTPVPGNETTQFTIDYFDGMSADGLYGFHIAAPLTGDLTVVGVGGRAAGVARAVDTVYYIYLIGDTTATNPDAVLIEDGGGYAVPSLPAGYDSYRLVGSQNTGDPHNFRPLRKTDMLVMYLDKEDGKLYGLDTAEWANVDRPVTLLTSFYTTKILLSVLLQCPPDASGDYKAFYKNYVGGTLGETHRYLWIDEGGGTPNVEGSYVSNDWIDLQSIGAPPGTRSFEDTLAGGGSKVKVWVTGFQEPV